MGRHMSRMLLNILGDNNIKVTGLCKPGAMLSDVTSSVITSEEGSTCSVIIGGSNDVAADDIGSVFNNLDTTLKKLDGTTTLVCTIPQRYDLPGNHYLHDKIYQANQYITELVSRYSTAYLINLGWLHRQNYTRHGFHINKSGKYRVANWIVSQMEKACHGQSKPIAPVVAISRTTPDIPCTKHNLTVATAVITDVLLHPQPPSKQLAETEEQENVEVEQRSNTEETAEEEHAGEGEPSTAEERTNEEETGEQLSEGDPSTAEEWHTEDEGDPSMEGQRTTVANVSLEGSPIFKGFKTPDRTNINCLQSLIDKSICVDEKLVSLKIDAKQKNYFLRKRKQKL